MAIARNLYIDQGSEFYKEFPVTDENKNVVNLSSFTASASMKKSYSSVDSIDLNANIPEPSNGIVSVYLTSDQSAELAAGRYVFDLVVTNTTTNGRIRAVEGICVVNPGVTL